MAKNEEKGTWSRGGSNRVIIACIRSGEFSELWRVLISKAIAQRYVIQRRATVAYGDNFTFSV